MPLSINRAPSEDLRPWVARLVATNIDADPASRIESGMCNDLPYARIVLRGDWTAKCIDGTGHYRDEPLLFGPHSRYMSLSCQGPVMAVGVALRPGALQQLTGRDVGGLVDRIEKSDPLGLVQQDLFSEYRPDGDPEQWLETLEAAIRQLIAKIDPEPPHALSTAFELAAFADPNLSLAQFAEQNDVSRRKLERRVKRDFGLTSKQVLRRARALDIAAQLCGVADEEEVEQFVLRYYDQSHLIREFSIFLGMTPVQFTQTPETLMTLALEERQARRLEALEKHESAHA